MTEKEDIVLRLQAILRQLDENGETIAALRIAEAIEVLPKEDSSGPTRRASDNDP